MEQFERIRRDDRDEGMSIWALADRHRVHRRTVRRALGDGAGTRALVGVLLLHRTLPTAGVAAGMTAALSMSSFDADLVAVEARRSILTAGSAPAPVQLPATVSHLAALERPAPSLADYDQLLPGATA